MNSRPSFPSLLQSSSQGRGLNNGGGQMGQWRPTTASLRQRFRIDSEGLSEASGSASHLVGTGQIKTRPPSKSKGQKVTKATIFSQLMKSGGPSSAPQQLTAGGGIICPLFHHPTTGPLEAVVSGNGPAPVYPILVAPQIIEKLRENAETAAPSFHSTVVRIVSSQNPSVQLLSSLSPGTIHQERLSRGGVSIARRLGELAGFFTGKGDPGDVEVLLLPPSGTEIENQTLSSIELSVRTPVASAEDLWKLHLRMLGHVVYPTIAPSYEDALKDGEVLFLTTGLSQEQDRSPRAKLEKSCSPLDSRNAITRVSKGNGGQWNQSQARQGLTSLAYRSPGPPVWVTSGIVGHPTQVVFRSKAARMILLIQLTEELWEINQEDGRPYFEKLIDFLHHFMTFGSTCPFPALDPVGDNAESSRPSLSSAPDHQLSIVLCSRLAAEREIPSTAQSSKTPRAGGDYSPPEDESSMIPEHYLKEHEMQGPSTVFLNNAGALSPVKVSPSSRRDKDESSNTDANVEGKCNNASNLLSEVQYRINKADERKVDFFEPIFEGKLSSLSSIGGQSGAHPGAAVLSNLGLCVLKKLRWTCQSFPTELNWDVPLFSDRSQAGRLSLGLRLKPTRWEDAPVLESYLYGFSQVEEASDCAGKSLVGIGVGDGCIHRGRHGHEIDGLCAAKARSMVGECSLVCLKPFGVDFAVKCPEGRKRKGRRSSNCEVVFESLIEAPWLQRLHFSLSERSEPLNTRISSPSARGADDSEELESWLIEREEQERRNLYACDERNETRNDWSKTQLDFSGQVQESLGGLQALAAALPSRHAKAGTVARPGVPQDWGRTTKGRGSVGDSSLVDNEYLLGKPLKSRRQFCLQRILYPCLVRSCLDLNSLCSLASTMKSDPGQDNWILPFPFSNHKSETLRCTIPAQIGVHLDPELTIFADDDGSEQWGSYGKLLILASEGNAVWSLKPQETGNITVYKHMVRTPVRSLDLDLPGGRNQRTLVYGQTLVKTPAELMAARRKIRLEVVQVGELTTLNSAEVTSESSEAEGSPTPLSPPTDKSLIGGNVPIKPEMLLKYSFFVRNHYVSDSKDGGGKDAYSGLRGINEGVIKTKSIRMPRSVGRV